MPVPLLHGGHGPGDRVRGYTVVDMWVLGDVAIVVVVNERIAGYWVVERQGGDDQEKTQNNVALFGGRENAGWHFGRLAYGCRQRKDLITAGVGETEASVVRLNTITFGTGCLASLSYGFPPKYGLPGGSGFIQAGNSRRVGRVQYGLRIFLDFLRDGLHGFDKQVQLFFRLALGG